MSNDIAGRSILSPEPPVLSAEEIEFLAGPQCQQCRHWRQMPRPKMDLAAMRTSPAFRAAPPEQQKALMEQARLHNAGALMGEERLGECRRVLLTVPLMVQTNEGPRLAGSQSYYPGNLPATFRACGSFAPKEPSKEALDRAAAAINALNDSLWPKETAP